MRGYARWRSVVSVAILVTCLWPHLAIASVTHSRPAAVRELLTRTPGAILLDVRTSEEYAQGHLPGSILVPLDRLAESAGTFLKDRDALIVIYCAVGGRSSAAAKLLSSKGYTNLINLIGGLLPGRLRVSGGEELTRHS
jgi:rhodanese-related sulfurtransferase